MTDTSNVIIQDSIIPTAGRGLFATEDIAPGDLILAIERPFVAELDTERLADTCAWCFSREETDPLRKRNDAMMGLPTAYTTVKACTGCNKVKYCGKKCQVKAWKREHKYECKAIGAEGRPDLPHGVRAVIKLLGRLNADPQGKDEGLLEILKFTPGVDKTKIERFVKQNPQRYEDFSTLSYGAWKYAGEPKMGDIESREIAQALFLNTMSNSITLSSALDEIPLGIGFDPWICSANHSCDPNSSIHFTQPRTLLRAKRYIKKGDEITMKYVDNSNPMSVRQAALNDSYFFDCKCAKCAKGPIYQEDVFMKPADQLKEEWKDKGKYLLGKWEKDSKQFPKFQLGGTLSERYLAAIQAEAFAFAGVEVSHDAGAWKGSLGEAQHALQMCLGTGIWPLCRQPVPHLLRQIFSTYLSIGDHYRAFRVGLKLYFEITPKLQPERFYPDRVIDTWAMHTLTNQLASPQNEDVFKEFLAAGVDLRDAYFMFLYEVHEQVPLMNGKDSPFGRVVENIWRQIEPSVSADVMKRKGDEVRPKLEALTRAFETHNL